MEVSRDNQRHLQVTGHVVSADFLVLSVIDVMDLDLVGSVKSIVNTGFYCDRVFSNVATVRVVHAVLGWTDCSNRVLIDELGAIDARRLIIANELSCFFRTKFG
mgnify:CR=1 FL=1